MLLRTLLLLPVFYLYFLLSSAVSQSIYQPADLRRVDHILKHLDSVKHLPSHELVVQAGKLLLDTPYVANALEGTGEEKLIVNLNALDCTTFAESVLALVITARSANPTFETYCQSLQRIRYRGGEMNGYTSRLHYFTDWLAEGQRNQVLHIVTADLQGQPYRKQINFMTTHRALYPALRNDSAFRTLKKIESTLNQHSNVYIPKPAVSTIENQLHDGDLIAISTNIAGLDVVHVGFAVRQKGRVHLLHASQTLGKVVISKEPLSTYLQKNATQSGIMVARLL